MRFRDRRHRLEKFIARGHGEFLLVAVRSCCRNERRGGVMSGTACRAQAEARRDSVLEHLEEQTAGSRRDDVRLLGVVLVLAMAVAVMVTAAAQEPSAGNIDGEADTGNRNRFGEMNLHRSENASNGFVANQ